MRVRSITIPLFVIFLIVLMAIAASAEMLLNPGFENWAGISTADNWTQYQTNGTVAPSKGSGFIGLVPASAHSGAEFQRIKLDAYNEEGGVYQKIATTSGIQYTVSAWILTRLTSVAQVEAKMGVDPAGGIVPSASTVWSTTVTGDSVWTQKSLTVTATGSYMTVFLSGRHPENNVQQCNVFFDDASAGICTAPAAPSSVAANPSTINAGQSATLTASVAGGCMVDWYSGSCNGTFVGSGTSMEVSPIATTTYYARARNIALGCVSASCGTPVTVTVNVIAHALNRPSDPIVLTGANVPSFIGLALNNLVAFRYSSGWQQIPIQVDERALIDFATVYNGYLPAGDKNLFYTDANTYTGPDPDPTIDSNDEIVFMAADAGPEAPFFSQPAGVILNTGIKVYISDPNDPGASAYVYLFRQNGSLNPGAGQQYVTYNFNLLSGNYKTTYKINSGPNPENSTITTPYYAHHFSDRWKNDELHIYTGGATGVDILDRHKALFAPGNCARSEDTFCNGEGAFVVSKNGPVRAIRSYLGANSGPLTQRDHIFYARRQDINTFLRVHAIGGIMDFFDYSPGASGMTYRNNNNTTPVTIDGSPDAVTQGQTHWELVDGAQGGLTIVSDIVTDVAGIAPTSYYLDDSTPTDTQCTGDAYAYGSSGQWINQGIACTDPAQNCSNYFYANRVLYYDAPGRTDADAMARHNWVEKPPACTFSTWNDTVAPVASFTATENSVNVKTGAVGATTPVTIQGNVLITVTASDSPAGLKDTDPVAVTVAGVTTGAVTGSAGVYSCTATINGLTGNGAHAITVTAEDKAGNVTTLPDWIFVNKNRITGNVSMGFVGAGTRVVTFVINGGTTMTASVNSGGTYTLTNVIDSVTAVSAKTSWSLRKNLTGLSGINGQIAANFTLFGGDLNGTNSININDYSVLKANWFTSNAVADINGSGTVNGDDYEIMKLNWFMLGD